VRKCLVKDVQDRPDGATLLKHPLMAKCAAGAEFGPIIQRAKELKKEAGGY
jgi:hypothetical protein